MRNPMRASKRAFTGLSDCDSIDAITVEGEMGQVIVRNLDDRIVAALKAKAQLHGQSLEQELRSILSKAALPNAQEKIALADRIRRLTPKRHQTDSTTLIREDRDR